jgi:hypothetical protein
MLEQAKAVTAHSPMRALQLTVRHSVNHERSTRMGDGIVGHITKGPVHRKVDDYVNQKAGGNFVNRAGFLYKLINNAATSAQYLTILQNDCGLTPAEVNYLATVWYNTGPGGSWPNLQPIYPVLLQGLIKAVQEAGTTLLLDSYWMPVAGPPVLAVITAKSPAQVTRIILTPPSHIPTMPRTQDAPMWAVTPQSQPPVQVGDTTTDAIVERVQNNIVTWRRREFPRAHA